MQSSAPRHIRLGSQMQEGRSSIAASTSLRVSLKRGMAKQAIELASKTSPNLLPVFRVSAALRPNAKHLERVARRIQQQTGICRVAYARGRTGINFTARMARPIDLQMDGQVAFREIGLIYLRVKVCWRMGSVGFGLDAVSFCQHAIERLVERSSLPLDDKLLAHLDSEAQAIFIGTDEENRIVDAEDEFHPASCSGLWAGGQDAMQIDPAWGLSANDTPDFPIFSVRTFLSEAQMRPTVWLRWKNNPSCQME